MANRQPSLSEEFNKDLPKTKGKWADLAVEWLTPEIQELFDAIPDPWRSKKRNTIMQMVYAMVNGTPVNDVFALPNVCSKVIWSTKWQHDHAIKAALSASLDAAQRWADMETVRIKESARRKRQQNIAVYSAQSVKALMGIIADQNQPAKDRIEATKLLVGWAEEPTAQQVSKATVAIEHSSQGLSPTANVSQLSDDVILKLLELARANDTATNSTDSQ